MRYKKSSCCWTVLADLLQQPVHIQSALGCQIAGMIVSLPNLQCLITVPLSLGAHDTVALTLSESSELYKNIPDALLRSKTQKSEKKTKLKVPAPKQLPVGVHAERLQCSVVGDVVTLAHHKMSAKKLKAAMGGVDVCYCCLLSRHEDPESMCPTPKAPGHERGGKMHVFDPALKEHILTNWKSFEAGWGNAKP